jgi:hypothetical protein
MINACHAVLFRCRREWKYGQYRQRKVGGHRHWYDAYWCTFRGRDCHLGRCSRRKATQRSTRWILGLSCVLSVLPRCRAVLRRGSDFFRFLIQRVHPSLRLRFPLGGPRGRSAARISTLAPSAAANVSVPFLISTRARTSLHHKALRRGLLAIHS